MEQIIARLFEQLKSTSNLIEAETFIYGEFTHFMSEMAGDILTSLDKELEMEKRLEGWKRVRSDSRTLTFLFGPVEFTHTLMRTPEGDTVYPIHEFLGLRPRQKYTPAVELKVAETASKQTYRETAKTVAGWTPVEMSHTAVGTIVKRVGKAQADWDRERVREMEEAAFLPEGKKVDFLFAEADGVHVKGTREKNSHEVHHAVLYEGWKKNGKRVSLHSPMAILTTQSSPAFWNEVQVLTASVYSLENTRVVTNSDGGMGIREKNSRPLFPSPFSLL